MKKKHSIYSKRQKNKSGGLFPSWLWQENAHNLYKPFNAIWRNSITTEQFPEKWKEDIITPIPKTKIVTNASELRPITVTEVPAKGLEKVVHRR